MKLTGIKLLFNDTRTRANYKHWSFGETLTFFLKGMSVILQYSFNKRHHIATSKRLGKWLKRDGENLYFDFNGAKLPDISKSHEKMYHFAGIFEDVLMFHCYLDDNYDKETVKRLDPYMDEGPYGYTDGAFDVTVKKDDIVIDAGAWIGDFSAYAAAKGATVYAFEPVDETFRYLCETAGLNNVGEERIKPIQKGLSDNECKVNFHVDMKNTAASSIIQNDEQGEIALTTLDKFAADNNLRKIDFIKADIEGAERDMLRGATNVLKTFAPKLAICTYHLPDDPEVLEKIIMEANPAYKVVHLRRKLIAAVINK
jgi:FkbM family methyltransferase